MFTPRKGGKEAGREELMASMQVRSLYDTLPVGAAAGPAVAVEKTKHKVMEDAGVENVSRVMGRREGGREGEHGAADAVAFDAGDEQGGKDGGREEGGGGVEGGGRAQAARRGSDVSGFVIRWTREGGREGGCGREGWLMRVGGKEARRGGERWCSCSWIRE